MARLPYPNTDNLDADGQGLVERIKKERGGRLLNLYRMLLNSPAMCSGWLNMLTNVRFNASLDGESRELAICEVASITNAEYEWRAHARLASQLGASQAQLDSLPNWRSGQFSDKQQAVLAYAEESTRNVQVDDATFDALKKHFDTQQILELTVTIGAYNMVSRLLVGLKVDLED